MNNVIKEKQRNSNIELLRIIAMLMIVAHHFIFYGVQQNYDLNIACNIYNSGVNMNKIFALFLLSSVENSTLRSYHSMKNR